MNNIIFFGPPGAGKGTQAKIIADFLDLPHLSTGEILRSKIEEKDNLGILVKEIIASGKLVSDKILNEIVSEKLVNDCNNGFILDGYPRTLDQSIFLNKFLEKKSLSINFIFNIEIDFKTLNNRIMIRSKKENREDDNISVIKTRYQEYLNTTKGVSEKYNKDYPEIFFNIDGDHEINEITSKIKKILLNS